MCNCEKNYETDRKPKTKITFCSRLCAGKYRRKHTDNKTRKPETGKYKRQLTREQAIAIYYSSNKTYQEIAEIYGTTKNMVWLIKSKQSYKWIHNI